MIPLALRSVIRITPPPGIVLVGDCHIVKGSVFVIGGAPGVGKSRSAVTLAVAGATGHDWFGLTVHRRFRTMIVQTENGEFRLAREFRELDCDALENFVRVCPPPPYGLCFRREDFRRQLEAAIADFVPDVVVYDPWNAAAREQDSREYLDTFDALKSVLPIALPEIANQDYVAGSLPFCHVQLFPVIRPRKIEDKTGGKVSNLPRRRSA